MGAMEAAAQDRTGWRKVVNLERQGISQGKSSNDDGGGEWWQPQLQDVQSSNQIITTYIPTQLFPN